MQTWPRTGGPISWLSPHVTWLSPLPGGRAQEVAAAGEPAAAVLQERARHPPRVEAGRHGGGGARLRADARPPATSRARRGQLRGGRLPLPLSTQRPGGEVNICDPTVRCLYRTVQITDTYNMWT